MWRRSRALLFRRFVRWPSATFPPCPGFADGVRTGIRGASRCRRFAAWAVAALVTGEHRAAPTAHGSARPIGQLADIKVWTAGADSRQVPGRPKTVASEKP